LQEVGSASRWLRVDLLLVLVMVVPSMSTVVNETRVLLVWGYNFQTDFINMVRTSRSIGFADVRTLREGIFALAGAEPHENILVMQCLTDHIWRGGKDRGDLGSQLTLLFVCSPVLCGEKHWHCKNHRAFRKSFGPSSFSVHIVVDDLDNDCDNPKLANTLILGRVASVLLSFAGQRDGYLSRSDVAKAKEVHDAAARVLRFSCNDGANSGPGSTMDSNHSTHILSVGDSQSKQLTVLMESVQTSLHPCLSSAMGRILYHPTFHNLAIEGTYLYGLYDPFFFQRASCRHACRKHTVPPKDVEFSDVAQPVPRQETSRNEKILESLFWKLETMQRLDLAFSMDTRSISPTAAQYDAEFKVEHLVRYLYSMVAEAEHVVLSTTSPFFDFHQPQVEIDAFRKAIQLFQKSKVVRSCPDQSFCHHASKGRVRFTVSIVKWHLLICPHYESLADECPHSAYGFENIFVEDAVHPYGIAGLYFSSQMYHVLHNVIAGQDSQFDAIFKACSEPLFPHVILPVNVSSLVETYHFVVDKSYNK